MKDNGFNSACPSGNSLIDCPEPKQQDDDYTDLQELMDEEERYERKEKEEQNEQ